MRTLSIVVALLLISPPQDEIQKLKSEISQLRKEVRTLNEQLAIAEHNGFHWPGVEPIGSPLSLIKDLPKELRLQKSGYWSKPQIAKVNTEFKQKNGQPFAAKLKIEKMTFRETINEGEFIVSFAITQTTFSQRGHKFTTKYNLPFNGAFGFKCDGETVNSLKKLNLNKLVPVSASVSNIELIDHTFRIYLHHLILDDVKLSI